MIKTGIGQDSHRIREPAAKPFMLGGVKFDEPFSLEGNSDSDVILHAVTNAISGVTGKPVLGPAADELCKSGITDSAAYLRLALADAERGLVHAHLRRRVRRPRVLRELPVLQRHLAHARERLRHLRVRGDHGHGGLRHVSRARALESYLG